jgi:hypothetical protein
MTKLRKSLMLAAGGLNVSGVASFGAARPDHSATSL